MPLKGAPILVGATGNWMAAKGRHADADACAAWHPRATLARTLNIHSVGTHEQLWRAIELATRERQASVLVLAPAKSALCSRSGRRASTGWRCSRWITPANLCRRFPCTSFRRSSG
jgi:hypothetical protein